MKIIMTILTIIALFIGAKKLMCTPDQQVLEASLPLAKVMVEYVEKIWNTYPKLKVPKSSHYNIIPHQEIRDEENDP